MLVNDKLNTLMHLDNLVSHVDVADHESTYQYVSAHHYVSRQLNYGLSQLYGNLYHKWNMSCWLSDLTTIWKQGQCFSFKFFINYRFYKKTQHNTIYIVKQFATTFHQDTQPQPLTLIVESDLSAGQQAPPPLPPSLHHHALATWSSAVLQRLGESSGFCLTCWLAWFSAPVIGLAAYGCAGICLHLSTFLPVYFQDPLTCDPAAHTRLKLDSQPSANLPNRVGCSYVCVRKDKKLYISRSHLDDGAEPASVSHVTDADGPVVLSDPVCRAAHLCLDLTSLPLHPCCVLFSADLQAPEAQCSPGLKAVASCVNS